MQSVKSATDTLGHRDELGLSATDPCPRQLISVHTMPKDVLVTSPHMSVCADNTTPISNYGST